MHRPFHILFFVSVAAQLSNLRLFIVEELLICFEFLCMLLIWHRGISSLSVIWQLLFVWFCLSSGNVFSQVFATFCWHQQSCVLSRVPHVVCTSGPTWCETATRRRQVAPGCAMLDLNWTYMCIVWLQFGVNLGRFGPSFKNQHSEHISFSSAETVPL